jgi:hypothetical protein
MIGISVLLRGSVSAAVRVLDFDGAVVRLHH